MTPESPLTFADIFKWLLSALGAVALWVITMFSKRLDGHEITYKELVEKVRELELNSVSRDTHHQHEVSTKDSIDALRREAITREERLVTEIRGVGTSLGARIDTLFQRPDR